MAAAHTGEVQRSGAEQLRSSLQASEWCIGVPPAEQFNQRCYRLIFDYPVADPEIQARLHGLELHRSEARVERQHAIKALVRLRRGIGGQSSPRGMRLSCAA